MNTYPLARYGIGAEARTYRRTQCAHHVETRTRGWLSIAQCTRKPGHGDRGLFCKQHAKLHAEVSA